MNCRIITAWGAHGTREAGGARIKWGELGVDNKGALARWQSRGKEELVMGEIGRRGGPWELGRGNGGVREAGSRGILLSLP